MKDFSIEIAVIFIVFFLCLFFLLLVIKAYLGIKKQKQIHFLNVQLYTEQYASILSEVQSRPYLNQNFQKQINEFYEKIIDLKSSLYFLKMVLNCEKK
ncbi:hypothetical protein [uncultured Planktosalinus sp.]|uniref:hypothetical protein n=1 Tax=uncultured Planktosalinus sp. TaxID=1810935 RepID=UPI0030DD4DF3